MVSAKSDVRSKSGQTSAIFHQPSAILKVIKEPSPDLPDKAQTAELLASKDRQIAEQAALIESQKKDIERITADRDQERDSRIKAEEQKKALIIQLNQQKQDHEEEMKELLPAMGRWLTMPLITY